MEKELVAPKSKRLSPYEAWQVERYGNYIPDTVPDSELEQAAFDELNRLAEWIETMNAEKLGNHF